MVFAAPMKFSLYMHVFSEGNLSTQLFHEDYLVGIFSELQN